MLAVRAPGLRGQERPAGLVLTLALAAALVQFAARVVKLAGVPELLRHPMAAELAEPTELLGQKELALSAELIEFQLKAVRLHYY